MKFLLASALLLGCMQIVAAAPKLMICSDSTTANYTSGPLQGWGYYIHEYLSIPVINLAKNGRSTRSFINEGLWKTLLSQTTAGDFVLIEMGHNDAGDPTKSERFAERGTLPGIGTNTATVKTSKGTEEVHTFGWYLREMIKDVQAKQAIPVLSGMVPTNSWQGDTMREKFPFAEYTQEVAKAAGVEYLDHTKYSVKRLGAKGPTVAKTYFPNDNTHTNPAGAQINAQALVDAIKCNGKSHLSTHLSSKGSAIQSPC